MDDLHCAEAKRTWMCDSCNGVLPTSGSIDIQIKEFNYQIDKPLSLVGWCMLGVAWKPFLDLFDSALLERDFRIGRVFGQNGEIFESWSTYHALHKVIVRGTQEARYRICAKCGRCRYSALGKRYLYPAPPDDAVLYGSDLAGFVMREDLFKRMDFGKWRRRIQIQRLSVPESPPDGLGILQTWNPVPPAPESSPTQS